MTLAKMFDVSGKSVVVTGGASGLGRAYAEVMADNGARVCLLDMDGDGAARVAREIGHATWSQQVDVADRPALAAAFDKVAETHGRIDVCFSNAGAATGPGFVTPAGVRDPEGQIDTLDEAHWDRALDVHLSGAFFTIRNAARHMKQTGGGRIVVTSSIAARVNDRLVGTPYMPVKAGVEHLVRNAAMELAEYGILVNCIAPGPFATMMGGGAFNDPDKRRAFEENSLLGRVGEAEEIKGLALYLASPASSFVTGSSIKIDGGFSLRG